MLGRPTKIVYSDQTITYGWDTPLKGKLGQSSDNSGTRSYSYDALERLTQISHTIPNGTPLSVAYTYDAAGQVLLPTKTGAWCKSSAAASRWSPTSNTSRSAV